MCSRVLIDFSKQTMDKFVSKTEVIRFAENRHRTTTATNDRVFEIEFYNNVHWKVHKFCYLCDKFQC